MLVDNFKGHKIGYELTNIKLDFMAPNMTAAVQPLDGSIIHNFKGIYRCKMCICAIELDDAGADNIYKMNLLKAMLLIMEAWNDMSQETIKNCWAHMQIEELMQTYVAPSIFSVHI